ncbi:MAG: phytoene desaturase family protein [Sphingobacteriales bacterium]|nr:phytoene desaturase family protein [Sphingobacteriales bacterium]
MKKAIIIGSGIAGIAASIRLSVQGYDVHVFEKNDYPGGKLSAFEKNGYRFDAGPSLFTQPQNVEELFALANEPIEDYFQYQEVEIVCHYFFENGIQLNTYADREKLANEFQTKLGEEPDSVKKYLSKAETLYDNIGEIFLNHSLHLSKTWLHKRVINALKNIKLSYLFSSLHQYNTTQFQSKEAVQIFNRFATYNGSNPYKAPAMLSLIPHLEQNQGTFYPKGGMINITNALYKLALKKGVQFHFNHTVEKIVHEQGTAKGIITNGEMISADLIVSNGDVYYTYKNLLQNAAKVKTLEKIERSSSALIFYWGIKKEFSQLGLHNILFSEKYDVEFDHLFNKKTLFNDPTIYINITSKMEANQAPDGCENWFVMINAPTNNGQDWTTLIQEAKQHIIQKLNRILKTDIESFIETEEILNPVTIEQKTGTYQGSLYGTSSNSKFAAFFRPANFSSEINGLYFCGGTVHPGGGIPLCLKSAYITSELIKKKYARD